MIAMCVDDESLLLRKLKRVVESSEYITETYDFDDEEEAIEWAETHQLDIAFLDIRLHSMDGIELCKRLRAYHPKLFVVFCTGWSEYMLDAFKVHGNGYILKPIQRDAVLEEIRTCQRMNELAETRYVETKIENALIVTFGSEFRVYDRNGAPLSFKRTKAKDMLEILVRRKGAHMPAWEICRDLWKGELDYWSESRQNYFYILSSELKKTLKSVGADAALIKEYDGYRVNMRMIQIRKEISEN